jgi:hypothetical protein
MSSAITNNMVFHIPGSAASDVGYVRITNTTSAAVQVRGTVYKLDGSVAGTADSILVSSLASQQTVILSAADLEGRIGSSPLSNSVRLEITSPTSGLVVMGWIMNATGDLVNMSESATSDLYFMPGSTSADAAFIRITNFSSSPFQVRGTVYTLDGSVMGTANSILVSSLAGKSTARLSISDLGNVVGANLATGNFRLHITYPSSNIVLMGTLRNSTGTLTNMTGSVGY